MNVEQLHRQTIQWAKLVKAHATAEYGIGEDMPVTLMAHGQDNVLLVQIGEDQGLSTGLCAALAASLRDCVIQHLVEAFTATIVGGSVEENWATMKALHATYDGGLQGAFAAGDERVQEAIVLTSFAAEGLMYAELPYRYHGRRVEWLDEELVLPDVIAYDDWQDEGASLLAVAVRDGYESDEPEMVVVARLMMSERERMEAIGRQIKLLCPDARLAVIGQDEINEMRLEDE